MFRLKVVKKYFAAALIIGIASFRPLISRYAKTDRYRRFHSSIHFCD